MTHRPPLCLGCVLDSKSIGKSKIGTIYETEGSNDYEKRKAIGRRGAGGVPKRARLIS